MEAFPNIFWCGIDLLGKELMEVEILCEKMIKPSAPTPPHLRTLKLSLFDQLQYSVKMPLLLYYSPESSSASPEDVERRNHRLQASLSETLTRFYPLAGRYVQDGAWVDCNDEGVEYLEAKVKGRLDELLSRRDEMIHQLVHLAGGESTGSMASVQINMFDCGGLVIATRVSHNLFDGFSAFNFISSWATACRQGIDEVVWPYFGLSSILPAKDLPIMKPLPPLVGTDGSVTRRLVIDKAKISSLRARAYDPSFQREATRVEVVTALLWRALMGVSRAKHGRLRTSLAFNVMNLRPNIVPSLPSASCGNLHNRVIARFVAESDNIELPQLKDLVGSLRAAFTKSKHTLVPREDSLSTMLRTWNGINEAVKNHEVDVFKFTSLCNFPFYQADFGWGKPVWVSRIHWPIQVTTLLDTEGGDGIEVWVTLNKQDMPRFLQDENILALTSHEAP